MRDVEQKQWIYNCALFRPLYR